MCWLYWGKGNCNIFSSFFFLFCEFFLGRDVLSMNWINVLTFHKMIEISVIGICPLAIFRHSWNVVVAALFRLRINLCQEGRGEVPPVQASSHMNCKCPLPPPSPSWSFDYNQSTWFRREEAEQLTDETEVYYCLLLYSWN